MCGIYIAGGNFYGGTLSTAVPVNWRGTLSPTVLGSLGRRISLNVLIKSAGINLIVGSLSFFINE